MTDHGSGSAERDDDYRLAAGTPQDGVPQDAATAAAGGGSSAGGVGGVGMGAAGTDGPPPQLSGQPGWAYTPTEMATPQVPHQSQGAGADAAGQAAGLAAGHVPGQAGEMPPQSGGYGFPQQPGQHPQPGQQQQPQQPFGAVPTQGYGYPGPGAPMQADGAAPANAHAQPYPLPPMAQPPYGQPSYGQQPGYEQGAQAPYGQPPFAQQQPSPQPPYQQQPYEQAPYGQAPYGQPGAGPDGQGQWPQMPPLPGQPTEGQPQPGYPYPGYPQPAAPPRGSLSRGALIGIVAGGVALVVIAVTAVALASNGGGGGGGTNGGGGGSVRTLATGWKVPGSVSDEQIGTWVTNQYLVRASSAGVKAYSLSTGAPAWTAQPLSGSGVPCAMSPTVSASGIGTVGFGPNADSCTTLVGVDTSTGKTLWSTSLTSSGHTEGSSTATFVDGQVGVIVNGNVLGGVNLTNGQVVWGYKARGQYCNAYPYGGAGTVIVDDYCADVSPTYTLTALDAATGKQIWQKQESDHVQISNVMDGSPIVATTESGGSQAAYRYDSSGNSTPLALPDPVQAPMRLNSADSGALVVGPSTLLVPTNSSSSRQGIAAVNPSTGATLWTYDGESHGGAVLVRTPQNASGSGSGAGGSDAGKVYAISFIPGYGSNSGPQIVSLDPASGKASVIAQLPSDLTTVDYSPGTVYLLPNGQVLLASPDASGTAVQLFK
ncbi:outer membrane protein assembly factor BamB family protein [Streptacidiphilus anmyonensis]|uniref:outer membrane protein assembly factor BamB family protein n=1 Tax=Streptacidiphilus anmyonensis TaxID=405782 RepID=UPI0005AAB683|nr:PQQ-binding-like beta-propeller repeat protein [Streptacidiphilus anmyonensis]